MIRSAWTVVVSSGLLLLAAGCSGFGDSPLDDGGGTRSAAPIVIRVQNQNWSDMTIYLVRGGTDRRLGQLTTNNTDTYRIPFSQLGSGRLWLRAEAIGSPAYITTDEIYLSPGDRLRWTIMNQLGQSHYEIF